MKKTALFMALSLGLATTVLAKSGDAFNSRQAEPFNGKILVEGLQSPWDMAIDRHGQLWVTELGGNILRVEAKTGKHRLVHHFDDVLNCGQQQGLLGMALGADFLSAKGENVLYAAYAYKGKDETAHTKIVKLTLDKTADKVIKTDIVLDKLASYTDHQGGRLRLGPDGKLYYTIGNQGANQYVRTCYADRAQRLPT